MSDVGATTSAAARRRPVREGPEPAATVRGLVLELAEVEDELRRNEARPVEDQDTQWLAVRAMLVERERVIVDALHEFGLSFAEHPSPARMLAVREAANPAEETIGRMGAAPPGPERDGPPRAESLAVAELLIENLKRGLLTRTVIGQAQGMLMERHRISGEEAFERLRICSQLLNRKLRDVARELVETGEEPLSDLVLQERAGRERPV